MKEILPQSWYALKTMKDSKSIIGKVCLLMSYRWVEIVITKSFKTELEVPFETSCGTWIVLTCHPKISLADVRTSNK